MQNQEVLSAAEAAYQRAVDAGHVTVTTGGVKRYTAADFPSKSTDTAPKQGANSPDNENGKTRTGGVKRYTAADFPSRSTDTAPKKADSSVLDIGTAPARGLAPGVAVAPPTQVGADAPLSANSSTRLFRHSASNWPADMAAKLQQHKTRLMAGGKPYAEAFEEAKALVANEMPERF